MVVLLIGGNSVLMNAMIDKLSKNGHRVYLLTGQKENRLSNRRVFETYYFTYDSGSVKDILDSIKPEAIVFTGAFDPNFTWEIPRHDMIRYTAGLMNILSAYSMPRQGRFLYLSSQEVFGEHHGNDIPEDEPVSPKGFRAMALAQGEEICATYRRTQDMDTITLRLDNLYWIPEKGGVEDNPCYRLCLQALKTGSLSPNSQLSFSLLYLNDAIEQIYKLICAPSPERACYHISSMEALDEGMLAEQLKAQNEEIQLHDGTVGMPQRRVLDGSRFQKEFGQKIFTHADSGVQLVYRFMKRHSSAFLTEEDTGSGLGVRIFKNVRSALRALFPYIENGILFLLTLFLNSQAAGSQFFAKLDFYLLYVLLFAVIYGQGQAVVSGILSVIGYIFVQMQLRSGFDILVDYNTYVWMAQLFIVGLTVGYLRDQINFIQKENRSYVGYLRQQLTDIEEINDSNVRMKHNFESQVVNQKESLGKIYELTSSLDQREPEEVLFYAAQVLSRLMDCPDVAIYTVANGGYARLFSATSPNARRLGNSVQYTALEGLYTEIQERRVYINRKMEDRLPMMANAVYSEDQMQLILMLWGLPWERMTLGEANRLTIAGFLIQNAVVRANRYLEALRNRRYVEGTNVLDEEAFSHLVHAFYGAREKGLTEYVLLEILAEGENGEAVAEKLGSAIRQTDYLGILQGDRLYALLANTNLENVGGVIERFQKAGYDCRVEGAAPAVMV